MKYTGERVVAGNLASGVDVTHAHIMRYAHATRYTFGKNVVDLGCGTGYGTHLLSLFAQSALGVDISEEVVKFCKLNFQRENLDFKIADLELEKDTQLYSMKDPFFVAFEVLEHINNPEYVLANYTPILWSMPVNDASRFHKRAYSIAQIETLTGGISWYQSRQGLIVPKEKAWFQPTYVLGLKER